MCGIVGILKTNGAITDSVIQEMRDITTHRGPDDAGLYVDNNVALGHRRLSIIDLSAGHQPMHTHDGKLCIVFNGEIYNYKALKNELEKKGHVFKTQSDTEVLLSLYREYGAECVKYLNGIFAFAVWDIEHKKLFLARDHLGIKPLYYYKNDNVFVFASEVKSIYASGELSAQCNTDAVTEYFVFRHVAGEQTLFKDIVCLMPGHSMLIENGKVKTDCYWSPVYQPEVNALTFEDAVEELNRLLDDAVKLQMVSDVPLGTFCSGGIDSSLVTALAAKTVNKPVNTFSVGFHESMYDETEYARMVSKKYGTEHHELRIDNKQFSDYLPKMIWHNDDPLNFPNSVHIFAISQLAKQYVTVVLTGEGADELFGGYPRYHIPRFVSKLKLIPKPVRQLAAMMLSGAKDHRLRKLSNNIGRSINETLLYNCATLDAQRIKFLVESSGHHFDYRDALIERFENDRSVLNRATMQDQNTYLASILNRQDKMSMAASIESRVPLLDYRLVEFANSLPEQFKQKGSQTKLILKKVAEKHLPYDVVYRRKSGFGIPLAEWFKEDNGLGQLARDKFNHNSLSELNPHIDPKKALSEHLSGSRDNSEFLWTALNFVLWKEAFGI